ncbi:MAG: dihydroorotate dehydrogenase electron transfer subunit [Spirochaetes bacterium]|nr:dihydroorotate dehydrogenase electron transfer subunit [Spirochaetota bacterium]
MIEKPIPVSDGHYMLKVEIGSPLPLPGQFVSIRVSEGSEPLLRRPFSIFNHEGGVASLIVKVVGTGTELLSRRGPGAIDLIGPLGSGFTIARDKKIFIAGGGVGNAPLYFLARALSESHCDVTYLYGARSEKYIYLENQFRRNAGHFILATDDGSSGTKGSVADIAAQILPGGQYDMIYTCGPAAMMEKITSLAGETPVEVSVENYFGCSIGLCSGCTIETSGGMKRACVDGPVFKGGDIRWKSMPD